jgi:hypothetical protein
VSITVYFYLLEGTSEDEFKLLSFIWMFKVIVAGRPAMGRQKRAPSKRRTTPMAALMRKPCPPPALLYSNWRCRGGCEIQTKMQVITVILTPMQVTSLVTLRGLSPGLSPGSSQAQKQPLEIIISTTSTSLRFSRSGARS